MTKVIYIPNLPVWLSNIGVIILSNETIYFTAISDSENDDILFSVHSLYSMNHDGTELVELPNHTASLFPSHATHGYAAINLLHIDVSGYLWTVESGNYSVVDNNTFNIYEQIDFYIIRKLDRNGEMLLEIDITYLTKGRDFFYVSDFCLDKDGYLYIIDERDIHVFDSYGNFSFSLTNQEHFAKLIRLGDGSVVHLLHQLNNTLLRRIDTLNQIWDDTIILPADVFEVYTGNEEFLAFFNHGHNLYGIVTDTYEHIKIINWLDNDIMASCVNDIIFLENGDAIIDILSYRGVPATPINEIIKLIKVPISEISNRTTLTIGTYYTNEVVVDAVSQFNRSSNTHRIKIIDYSLFNTTDNLNAGITRLIIDFITDQGPDMLDLTFLPFESLVNRGFLININPLLDADDVLKRSDVLESFLLNDEIDGKNYRITPGFTIRTIIGPSSVLGSDPGWTMNDFVSILNASQHSNISLWTMFSKHEFLFYALIHNMNDYIDHLSGAISFDNESFIKLLEIANKFPDDIYKPHWIPFSKDQLIVPMQFGTFDSYKTRRAVFGNDDIVFKGFPVENKNGHILVPYNSVAITTICKDIEGAWEFIRTLLMYDFQRNFLTHYFPVNKVVFEERLAETMNPRYVWYVSGEPDLQLYKLFQNEADMIMMIIENSSILKTDEALMNIVQESASGFFNGRMTAQETAKIVQSRANIYFSEQR